MKLKKVTINGKVYFEEVTETADGVETIDVSETPSAFTVNSEGLHINFSEVKQATKRTLRNAREAVHNAREAVHNARVGLSILLRDSTRDLSSKSRIVLDALPYMEEEDVHEILVEVLDGNPIYEGVSLSALLPFLSEEDCAAVLHELLDEDPDAVKDVLPFVEEEDLSHVVDAYMKGRYPTFTPEMLYPYLSGADRRRLLEYTLKNPPKARRTDIPMDVPHELEEMEDLTIDVEEIRLPDGVREDE